MIWKCQNNIKTACWSVFNINNNSRGRMITFTERASEIVNFRDRRQCKGAYVFGISHIGAIHESLYCRRHHLQFEQHGHYRRAL